MFASHPLTEFPSPMLQVMLSCVKISPEKSRVHAFNFTMSLLTSLYERKPDELASGNVTSNVPVSVRASNCVVP